MVNIHKYFERVHALKGVDFSVYKGEVVGLVGDNGAGKSTLIKILAGVIPKDEGEIYWEGKKVEIRSVKDARNLGIETVFQEQALVDVFTLSQNVFLGRELTKTYGPIKVVDYRKMDEETRWLLRRLNLRIAESPRRELRFCSGGEKQGVAISRAMYFQAKLIILDEPTRGLSVAGVEQVLDFVSQLKKEGIACIFITHNFQHVYPVADRFVLLSRGVKVLDEPKSSLSIEKLEARVIEAAKDASF
jgi:simple sugar transport system ATP-binding protein